MDSVDATTLQLAMLLLHLACGSGVWLLRARHSRHSVYDRWLGAQLAAAAVYLLLLQAAYLPAKLVTWLACLLLLSKGSLLLVALARLLQQTVPRYARRSGVLALATLCAAVLAWLPASLSGAQLALVLAVSALYQGGTAALLLPQREGRLPGQYGMGQLHAGCCVALLLYIVYLARSGMNGGGEVCSHLLLPAMLFATLQALMFITLVKEQELSALHTLATLDPLTGIFNRRSFEELARKLCAQHARQQRSLALLVIDLDHFKRINDTYGHSRGDMALKALAELVTEQVRTADIFARYGGEEFCLLLPDTGLDGAREVATKLCQQINTIQLEAGQTHSALSASIGVASLVPLGHGDWQQLFELADRRLYRAKSAGRNQLVWSD